MIGIRRMVNSGCDCKEEIGAIEQTVRLYPFSYPRGWFTDGFVGDARQTARTVRRN